MSAKNMKVTFSPKTQELLLALLDAIRADMEAPKQRRTVIRTPTAPANEVSPEALAEAERALRRKKLVSRESNSRQ